MEWLFSSKRKRYCDEISVYKFPLSVIEVCKIPITLQYFLKSGKRITSKKTPLLRKDTFSMVLKITISTEKLFRVSGWNTFIKSLPQP